jgi:pyruvate dehydrogenase E2 component (dihydrolipoamide acetyltransferase)
MAYIVRMPKLDLETSAGTLRAWHVGEGEAVEAADVIATVESERTRADVAARESGVLRRRDLAEGETCEPGEPIGILAGPGEDVSGLEATVGAGEPSASDGTVTDGGDGRSGTDEGTGGPTVREERPLRGTRRTIADRLGESYRNAVHVTERRTVDAEALVAVADAADATFDADVSVTDVLLLALSETLAAHPAFNARYEDEIHRLYEERNVCVAVDTESGLLAPVIRDVGAKSVDGVATARREVTERVLADEHTMADLAGGTFTVTNLGPFGVESFDPIINPPQVAILGINAVARAAVPAPDGTGVTVRRRLPLNLSFDHRVVDGADAARFLATLADHCESPRELVGDEVRAAAEGS